MKTDREFELEQALIPAQERVIKALAVRTRLTAPGLGMFEELRPVDGCSPELFAEICREVDEAADASDAIERELVLLHRERGVDEPAGDVEHRIMT